MEALEDALEGGTPEIMNNDQGSQFTGREFTNRLKDRGIAISMDGKGRAIDNAMIERLGRTVKYEDIYLKEYINGADLQKGLRTYFHHFTSVRKHTWLDRQTPAAVYRSGRLKRDVPSI